MNGTNCNYDERGKEKEQRFRILTVVSLYRFLYRFIAQPGIWAPFTEKASLTQATKETPENT